MHKTHFTVYLVILLQMEEPAEQFRNIYHFVKTTYKVVKLKHLKQKFPWGLSTDTQLFLR